MSKIAILMTCFNRCDKTEKCLASLKLNEHPECKVYLVNDGCTDGTEEMVKIQFPMVKVLQGDGNLYWNRGMNFAFNEAKKEEPDFYLWINDDVVFVEGLIDRLLNSYLEIIKITDKESTIIVGYTTDDEEKNVTYGGYTLEKGMVPISLKMVKPSDRLEKCDTFNGNCVLIHKSVVNKIGYNCDYYRHSSGDIDYGLTANNSGCDIFLTNYSVGKCEKNCGAQIWNDIHYRAPIQKKYKAMTSIRNRPTNEWIYFTKKFGGNLWFIRFAMPYIKLVLSSLITKFER